MSKPETICIDAPGPSEPQSAGPPARPAARSPQRRGLIARIDATGVPLLLARLGVGGMFLYLAIMKLLDPIEFLKQIREYHVLPESVPIFLTLTATTLPWLEVLCAMAVLIGFWRRGAALLIAGMLAFFTPMLIWRAAGMVSSGEVATFCGACFDCGCGTGVVCICPKLAENFSLLAGALIVLFSRSNLLCLSRLFAPRTPAP